MISIKSLWCKHKYMPYGEYLDSDNGVKTLKHIWKCNKCGKLQYPKKGR